VLEDRTLPSVSGVPFTVNPDIDVNPTQSASAGDSMGDTLVAWTSENVGSSIEARLFNEIGNYKSDEFTIQLGSTAPVVREMSEPAVAMDRNGDFVVTWTDTTSGSIEQVWAKLGNVNHVNDPDNGLSPVIVIGSGRESRVGMDSNGDFVVSYTLGGAVRVARYVAGGTLVENFSASYLYPSAHASSIACAPDGGFALAFEADFQNPVNSNVVLQQRDASDVLLHTQQWNSPDPINGTQIAPSVAVDDLGNPVLAFQYHTYLDTSWNISAAKGLRYGDLGDFTPIASGDTIDVTAAVAADPGNDNYIVAYKQHPSMGVSQVWVTEVTTTGTSTTSTLIDSAQDLSTLAVSVNTEHRFLVTYTFDATHLEGLFGQLGGLAGSPVSLSPGDHVLTVTGDGRATNTITIRNGVELGSMAVIVNSRQFDLDWADAAGGVFVNGDQNTYTIDIEDVSHHTPVTVNTGTGISLVDLSTVDFTFDGSLTVNGHGVASLEVSLSSLGGNTYNLEDGSLTSPELPDLSIHYSNIRYLGLSVPGDVHVKGFSIANVDAAITGVGESGSVVVDFTAGSPIPAGGGLYVDAGDGTLNLVGNAFRHEADAARSPTSGSIVLTDGAPNPIYTLSYANVASITDPGAGLTVQSWLLGDIFTVNGTPINGLSLFGAAGSNNVVNVQATTGPFLFTGHGTDTVNVGNAHRVQSIAGKVTLGETSGSIRLTVDDSADTGSHKTVVVGAAALTGLAPASIAYSNLASLTVRGGLGNDRVTLGGGLPKLAIALNKAGGINTLVAPNTVNTWLLNAFNGGRLNQTVAFANFQNLVGGSTSDRFQFAPNGSLTGTINGGAGANTLDYSGDGGAVVAVNLQTLAATRIRAGTASGFSNIQTFVGSSSGRDNLVGPSGTFTYWFMTGATAGNINAFTFSAFENLFGGSSGTNVLVGTNTNNTWVVNGVNHGTLGPLNFTNFQILYGGTAADSFQFGPTGALSGGANGGPGNNTLDYSNDGGAAVTVNLDSESANRLKGGAPGGFANIQGLFGSSSTADSLTGANAATTWDIVGANIGTVNTFAFVGVENLFGGNQSDTFKIEPAGRIGSIHGGKGDWLNYATFVTPVTVNLTTGSATFVGGGAAGAVGGIPNVYGGGGTDHLTGGPAGGVLIGGAGNDTLTAGTGRTILIGGSGSDILTGGPADDILISGTTNYDLNPTALAAILAEWQRTDIGYGQRITDLRAGTGLSGGNRLIWGTTVHDDGVADTLTGNGGQDWFFANLGPTGVLDHITDRNNGGPEQVN
jgi:hypothetical protein